MSIFHIFRYGSQTIDRCDIFHGYEFSENFTTQYLARSFEEFLDQILVYPALCITQEEGIEECEFWTCDSQPFSVYLDGVAIFPEEWIYIL